MAENNCILKMENVTLRFGGVDALVGVNLEVKQDEILAIIGPNGAGKTCILNCISGFYRPQEGNIFFNDKNIMHMPSHKIAEMGIARTFQNIELYTGLSTVGNLMAARHFHYKSNVLAGALYFGWAHRDEMRNRRKVEDIIDLLEMQPIRKNEVGTLPYGLRKRVELGRALAMEPKLLLLDEPMAGMNLEEKEDMARYILDVFELDNVPIVLIEHDMGLVMDIADRIVVLEFGKVIAEGTPAEIRNNPRVIKSYLGEA